MLSYKVEIRTIDGDFTEQLTHCNGELTEIRANLFCEIPMPILRTAPFSLVRGEIVIAKV